MSADYSDELIAELRRIANAHMRKERENHTLQPTALVNEAFLKLANNSTKWNDRTHFLAVASRAMRQILLDYGKARRRDKRGGGAIAVELTENIAAPADSSPALEDLSDALEKLEKEDPRLAEVVQLRYLGGMTVEEVAKTVGRSPASVKRDWTIARLWLARELTNGSSQA